MTLSPAPTSDALPTSRQHRSETRRKVAALVGNPNTGKTTLFNALSGLNQRVGNYPGVTVETKTGSMICAGETFDLVDLPGTYSLAPRSPDEMVAVDVILGRQSGQDRPDVVVVLVDASNLDRNLYLTTQVLELGVPVVIALNMIDVAERQGLKLDIEGLSRRLGVAVIPIQANRRRGLEELRSTIASTASAGQPPVLKPSFPEAFEVEVKQLQTRLPEVPEYLARRALLDVGGYTEQRLGASLGSVISEARERLNGAGCAVPGVEARTRYGWIREITGTCVRRPAERPVSWTDRLDRVLTHRLWGSVAFLGVMFLVFQSIFTLAKPLMKLLSALKDSMADLVRTLPSGPFTSLLADGVVEGVGAVILFLPQILILFAFIAILEDCGYMARAAFLMDRIMARCGLSGKSFIPLLSSMACAVPGILATRVIEDRRDRLATILVAPLMSCSARLPVYILVIGAFLTEGRPFWLPGLVMFLMYLLGLVLAPLVALILKRTLLRGQTPVFVMEMPSYKCPTVSVVVRRMLDSGMAFLRRAGTLILASMVLVWLSLYYPTTHPQGGTYPERITALQEPVKEKRSQLEELQESIAKERRELRRLNREERLAEGPDKAEWTRQREQLEQQLAPTLAQIAPLEKDVKQADDETNELLTQWKAQSWLGQVGQWMEPVFRPLGWDWRLGVAALASFPAREVVVGTLGILYGQGKVDTEELREDVDLAENDLSRSLRQETSLAGALALMVFFALCCQCASTLAVIQRETKGWVWPAFTLAYMTVLAYVGALLTYQVGRLFT